MSSEHAYCRLRLREVMKDVKKVATKKEIKWALGGMNQTEFHGPNGFYWSTRGCCRWDVKAQGWEAYLHSLEGETSQSITIMIKKCDECPHLQKEAHSHTHNWMCKAKRPLKRIANVEYPREEPKRIPKWCPYLESPKGENS